MGDGLLEWLGTSMRKKKGALCMLRDLQHDCDFCPSLYLVPGLQLDHV